MTKTNARLFIKRAREDLRDMEAALVTNDLDLYEDAVTDLLGAASALEEYLDTKGTASR